jgi:hypothetical protein
MLALLMVINRRSKSSSVSRRKRKNPAGNLPHAANKVRTRTSLTGMTIYQPSRISSVAMKEIANGVLMDALAQFRCGCSG